MITKVRSILFNFWMPFSAVCLTLVFWPLFFKREWSLAFATTWAKAMVYSLKVICGIDHKIYGSENLPTGPALLAVKHQSMWETMVLASLLDKPCFILKKELVALPIFGWWCKAAGYIGVDREAGPKAMRNMLTDAKERIAQGHQVVIFPEGTRIAPGETGDYQPGVAGLYKALGLPCVPVAHNSGLYWQHPGIVRKAGLVSLQFGTPICAGKKRREFMPELETAIEEPSREFAHNPHPSTQAASATPQQEN